MLALSAVTQSPTNGFSDCPAVEKVQESSSPEHTPTAQARRTQIALLKVVTTRIFFAQGGLPILLGPHVATAPQAQTWRQRFGLYSLSHDRRTRPASSEVPACGLAAMVSPVFRRVENYT